MCMDTNNRVLHMNEHTRDAVEKATVWAEKLGKDVVEKLRSGLDYLRTFSGGPEENWMTTLTLDVPFKEDAPSFIGTIFRRPEPTDINQDNEFFFQIGMIYDEKRQEWSFHS